MGLVQKELFFSLHRILDQYQPLAAEVEDADGGGSGVFEAEHTKNVSFHEKKNHSNGGSRGSCGWFLKRFRVAKWGSEFCNLLMRQKREREKTIR